jgi:predicted transcriptional regulator
MGSWAHAIIVRMPRSETTLRLPPDIAEAVATFSDYERTSQNAWIVAAVAAQVIRRRADDTYMTGLAKHYAGKVEQLEP